MRGQGKSRFEIFPTDEGYRFRLISKRGYNVYYVSQSTYHDKKAARLGIERYQDNVALAEIHEHPNQK